MRFLIAVLIVVFFFLLGLLIVNIRESAHVGIGIGNESGVDEDGYIIDDYSFVHEMKERLSDAGLSGILLGVVIMLGAAAVTVWLIGRFF